MLRSHNLLQVHSWIEDDAHVAYQSAGLGCVLGQLEGHLDMALRSQIIDFLRVRLPAVEAQVRFRLSVMSKRCGCASGIRILFWYCKAVGEITKQSVEKVSGDLRIEHKEPKSMRSA